MNKLVRTVWMAAVAVLCATGCERNDLGRYCVVGQPVDHLPNPDLATGQPSLTVLNIQAPECNDRICIQQGPVQYHPEQLQAPERMCDDSWCMEPYHCIGSPAKCGYTVKAVCTRTCNRHSDCDPISGEANDPSDDSAYVCHKQADGDSLSGRCICKNKAFLINPATEPSRFYRIDEEVPQPTGCQ